MTTYERAKELVAADFWIFPSKSKRDHILDWPNAATRDLKQIAAWFGPNGTHEFWSVSIFTGRYGESDALVVVDIDERSGGFQTANGIELNDPDAFPDTRQHKTKNNGLHVLYRMPRPGVKSGAGTLGTGIDIRSAGGLIHFGEGYSLTADAPIAQCPAWIIERSRRAKERPAKTQDAIPVDQERAADRAIHYLKNEAPVAVQGQGGDHTTFTVAAAVKDRGVHEAECLDLMLTHWNKRNTPPWDAGDLEKKVRNAYEYGTEPVGVSSPEAAFNTPFETATGEADVIDHDADNAEGIKAPWLREMNARYAVVNYGGETLVCRRAHNVALNRTTFEWSQIRSLRALYQNDTTTTFDKMNKPLVTDKADAWLRHPGRRTFPNGVTFLPGIAENDMPPGVLNLWTGWGIEPKKGTWRLLASHLFNVVCNRNREHFRYLMNWFALMVQKPGEPGQVAVVFRGGKGVGKSIVAAPFLRIFGQHTQHIINQEHLIGHFSGHLAEACFIFVDEAVAVYDKKHAGAISGMITEATTLHEAKFKEAVVSRNAKHFLLASNDSFLVPAGPDERRYFVLDVSPIHQQDRAYFEPLWQEVRGEGAAAMFYDLLHRKIDTFDVFQVPQTEALLDQKIHHLSATGKWLFACLQEGEAGFKGYGGADTWGANTWLTYCFEIPTWQAHLLYQGVSKQTREWSPQDSGPWVKELKKMLPECVTTKRPWNNDGPRPTHLVFRPLPECRKAFENWIGHSIEWRTDSETEQEKVFGFN